MANFGELTKKPVVIFFEQRYQLIECEHHLTLAQVRSQWQNVTNNRTSIAFFSAGRYLNDSVTVGQALTRYNSTGARTLELTAIRRWRFWVEVCGFEETRTLFDVAPTLTPGAVGREIEEALGIHVDDYRLMWGQLLLNKERTFEDNGLVEFETLMVDLSVVAIFTFPDNGNTQRLDCFASDCIRDLRQELDYDDDMALVVTEPEKHVPSEHLRLSDIFTDILDLEMPIHLTAEKKILLSFQPITLDHLRQQLPVALSSTPCDVYHMVSESFDLKTEFRFILNGKELDNCEPFASQLPDFDSVIDLDILRPCCIRDLWRAPGDEHLHEMVFLYSTESAYALYMRDELNEQRLFHDGIHLTIFGAMIDVFGPVSGRGKPVILVDREVERSFPILTFDGIERKMGWAQDLLWNIVPTSGCLVPKEIMFNHRLLRDESTLKDLYLDHDSLMIRDPKKVFICSDKKVQLCRFAHNATFGDVRARVRQMKGGIDVGLKTSDADIREEEMNRKIDQEILFVTHAERFRTNVIVTMGDEWYACCFEPPEVTFTNIVVNVGKQAKVLPRHLFQKPLYCCGCGRKVTQEEEEEQKIPSTCCKVRSLKLTDRRLTSRGMQSAVPRRQDVSTSTLWPEERDACVGTESAHEQLLLSGSPEPKSASKVLLKTIANQPSNYSRDEALTNVPSGSKFGAVILAAQRASKNIFLGRSPLLFTEEVVYDRGGQHRRAIRCSVGEKGYCYLDTEDGEEPESELINYSYRILSRSSPLPPFSISNVRGVPIFFIETETQIFKAGADRQLIAADRSALRDPSFSIFLRVLRSGAAFYWELSSDTCVNAESGEIVWKSNISSPPLLQLVFAMFGDGDAVPRINLPKYETLRVYRRAGYEVRMASGLVRCESAPEAADLEAWDFPCESDVLDKEFSDAARA